MFFWRQLGGLLRAAIVLRCTAHQCCWRLQIPRWQTMKIFLPDLLEGQPKAAILCGDLGHQCPLRSPGPVTAPFVKFRAAQLRGLVQQICHSPCDTRISLAHEGTAFFHSPTVSRSNFNAETVQCSASWQVTPECLLVNPATETHTAFPEAHSKTCLRMQLHIESAHSLRTFVIHCSAA